MLKPFTYIDKNRNVYDYKEYILNYKAIQKKDSSSLVYSGGKDRQIKILPQEEKALLSIIDSFVTAKDSNRSKGTSTFIQGPFKCTLAYRSKAQNEIESALETLVTSKDLQVGHSDFIGNRHDRVIHLLLDGVTDIKNIGAAYRLADAAGLQKVILIDSGLTTVNPKITKISRHTCTSIFSEFSTSSAFDWGTYTEHPWQIIGIEITKRSIDYRHLTIPETKNLLLIIGSERCGISESVLAHTNTNIHVPMYGKNSSMNVIQAAGICIFSIITKS